MDSSGVRLRHELKYLIDRGACLELRERLSALLRPDAHASGGGYEVRSLYFDDIYASAYTDKTSGLLRREKFRLRIYDGDDGCIKLERKAKFGALCRKESERLTRQEYDALLSGVLPEPDAPGLRGALRTAARTRLLAPSVIVEYRREAFVCEAGNVRVTFDKDLCACVGDRDLFSGRLRRDAREHAGHHSGQVLHRRTAIENIGLGHRFKLKRRAHAGKLCRPIAQRIQPESLVVVPIKSCALRHFFCR